VPKKAQPTVKRNFKQTELLNGKKKRQFSAGQQTGNEVAASEKRTSWKSVSLLN
jgi:hypothetical protein